MHNRHEWYYLFEKVERIHIQPSHSTGEQSIQCLSSYHAKFDRFATNRAD